MSNHTTPGNWQPSNPRRIMGAPAFSHDVSTRDNHVATVYGETAEEAAANAHLMASAPDLLRLVRWSCARANGWKPTEAQNKAHHAECLAAIAALEGGL